MWALISVGLFHSIMFPTIFTLGIRGLGPLTEEGSGLLIMAIAGGALVVIQGQIADALWFAGIVPVDRGVRALRPLLCALGRPCRANRYISTGRLTMRAASGLLAMLLFMGIASARDGIDVGVDTEHPGTKLDRHVFGQFAEDLGTGLYGGIWVGHDSSIPNTRGIRNDVVAALKDLHVPVVRWPGGCFADEYHWQDGIGPAAARRPQPNYNWGGVLESNEFGTDEFMDFAQQIGTEAYISVNVGSGTVKEAADWLQYMTADAGSAWGKQRAANGHPAPYRVAMLGLGNESWDCGGHMSAAEYSFQLKLYARFVHNWNKAQPLQRVAVGPNGAKTEYTEAVMKLWKDNARLGLGSGGPVFALLHRGEMAAELAGDRFRRARLCEVFGRNPENG